MDNNKLPNRKLPRLKGYDYSRSGLYFVTICTKEHKQLLSNIIVGRADPDLTLEECMVFDKIRLTKIGEITEKHILNIEKTYSSVKVKNYVIMPNHIHLLLLIDNGMQRAAFPTEVRQISVSEIVKSLKSLVARDTKKKLFQTSFHDHIIRNSKEYEMIWNYIEHNPHNWFNDRYYSIKDKTT
ncbi:MAG: transposase [Ruminococcaceae bacterium]|nr:transposase [Oscillospiraceae bacterium]